MHRVATIWGKTEMQIAARYFDHHLSASVIEYALENARALWIRTQDNVVRVHWCPRAAYDDEFQGGQHSVFEVMSIHHTDDANPERAGCVLLFGPDQNESDDNAIGIEFKPDALVDLPKKGQTVAEYIAEACGLRNDSKVLEKALTPSLLTRLGSIPIIPLVEPVEFVKPR